MPILILITKIGGDLNEFLPIVVNPREVTSSSDLTLEEAVNLVADQGSRTGNSYRRI